MFVTDNLFNIKSISLYQAPPSAKVRPFTIPDRAEVIEIITGGKVFFELDGVRECHERGTIFWHLPGEHTVWDTPPDAPYNCLSIHVKTHQPFERRVPRITRWEDEEDLRQFIKHALRCFHDDSTDQAIFFPYVYAKIFWQAYYYTVRKPAPGYPPFLQKLIYHIYRNLEADLSVETLAELSGMSVPYIHSQFKKHLGTGPHQYVLNRRLQKARNLLAGSSLMIKEICAQCGFANIESFYRAFRRHFGLTPGEYRNKYTPYTNL